MAGMPPVANAKPNFAFITTATFIGPRLTHVCEPPRPPLIAPVRGPPAWDGAPEPMPDWGGFGQPEPDVEFDQRVAC